MSRLFFNVVQSFSLLMDYVFPPKCIFCNKLLYPGIELEICDQCYSDMPFIRGKACIKCGQPLDQNTQVDQCVDCKHTQHLFVQGAAPCEYNGTVRGSIVRLKFHGKKRYAKTFGILMSRKIKQMTSWPRFDIIIYTPIHFEKKRERGYNQAKLLADILGKEIGCPVGAEVLIKTRHTVSQSKLDRKHRQENLKGAFRYNEKAAPIQNMNVLLVDDVYTTGATVDECCRIILEAGANSIYISTAAIGKGTY